MPFDARIASCFFIIGLIFVCFFELPSQRVEKDQGPQHLGLRPALKAFRSSPHTTWAPGDKTADCRLLVVLLGMDMVKYKKKTAYMAYNEPQTEFKKLDN